MIAVTDEPSAPNSEVHCLHRAQEAVDATRRLLFSIVPSSFTLHTYVVVKYDHCVFRVAESEEHPTSTIRSMLRTGL